MSGPVSQNGQGARVSVCANIKLSITNLRDRERVLSI